MLFSYNKNVNFPIIKIGNNKINETQVTKFLSIHLDKKLNFVNHITEISIKVAKPIRLIYKLNSFLPKTVLKSLYTSLMHPYLSYCIEAWHGTYQNNTSKIFVLQKKAIRAINNLAYNEQTNAYFKCNKILKFSDQYKLQVSNYIFNYYTPILMKKQSRVYLSIIKFIAIIQGPTTNEYSTREQI